MGFLDNIITAISPEAGYKREAWRQALEELRGYDAASHGRLNAGWRVFNESAELTDRYSRDVIRARARDLERNSDIGQSVIRAFRRNVFGKGYKLQPKTGSELLNDQLGKLWKQWCRKENCDITASQSFNQIMRMATTRKQVDGGILFVKRYTRGGLVPFKLQMIEVDELDTTASIPRHKGNTVVGGIEYDPARRAVGYFIQQYDVEGWKLTTPVYIEAKYVIPYWTKRRPSQLREVSDLAPTITRVRDTNEFITAVSVKESRLPGRVHQTSHAGGRFWPWRRSDQRGPRDIRGKEPDTWHDQRNECGGQYRNCGAEKRGIGRLPIPENAMAFDRSWPGHELRGHQPGHVRKQLFQRKARGK